MGNGITLSNLTYKMMLSLLGLDAVIPNRYPFILLDCRKREVQKQKRCQLKCKVFDMLSKQVSILFTLELLIHWKCLLELLWLYVWCWLAVSIARESSCRLLLGIYYIYILCMELQKCILNMWRILWPTTGNLVNASYYLLQQLTKSLVV